jgi:hypothetical protein
MVALLKQTGAQATPYVSKTAAVGNVTGFTRVVAWGIAKFTKRQLGIFTDAEKAKDWLVGGGDGEVIQP